MAGLLALALISGNAAMAQGLCFCPLCAFGLEKLYRQSSEAMAPTIRSGDCIRATLGNEGLAPGQVVVFRHPSGRDHMFRVIALAGQRVAVAEGVPVVDGRAAMREIRPPLDMDPASVGPVPGCDWAAASCAVPRFRETLPGRDSYEVLDAGPGTYIDNMAEVTVPAGHVFVLGDHRDNAMDSRVTSARGGPGMVAIKNIIGTVAAPRQAAP